MSKNCRSCASGYGALSSIRSKMETNCPRSAAFMYRCDSPCPFCENEPVCFGRQNPYYEGPCPAAPAGHNCACAGNRGGCAYPCAHAAVPAAWENPRCENCGRARETGCDGCRCENCGDCRACGHGRYAPASGLDMYALCPACGNTRAMCTCGGHHGR